MTIAHHKSTMTEAIRPEVVNPPEKGGSTLFFTTGELRWRLTKTRGKRLPYRTLKHWIDQLGMTPDSETGLYTAEDLELLRRLVLALKRRMTIRQFMHSIAKDI
jgi:hypothetical protein